MKNKWLIAFVAVHLLLITSAFLFDKEPRTTAVSYAFTIDTLATHLVVPWEIVFLPDKTMLFTERDGKVRIYRNNRLLDKPALFVNPLLNKKTGLLGLCLHPDFAANHKLYLAYNYDADGRVLLKVFQYRFASDTLVDPVLIIDSIPGNQNHTGCRLKFSLDKKLYISTGDADQPMLAQDLKTYNGKILRLNEDGSIPEDNPFYNNDTARKSIWSYGHRNCQGLTFQPVTNTLFNSEHGPTGGDEINIIQKGNDYGWPLIHHADTMMGMITPLLQYTPSVGPSEAIFYTGNTFPQLKNHLLVACLRGESIINIQLNGNKVVSQDMLPIKGYGRIRALTVGPDGYLYFSTSQKDPPEGTPKETDDMILRIRPATANKAVAGKKILDNKTKSNSSQVMSADVLYTQLCASCHGADLRGSKMPNTNLADNKWLHGSSENDIAKSIKAGIINKGMPAWNGALKEEQVVLLTNYILAKTKGKK